MLHEKVGKVARGTEVDIMWLKVDWTDFIKNSREQNCPMDGWQEYERKQERGLGIITKFTFLVLHCP